MLRGKLAQMIEANITLKGMIALLQSGLMREYAGGSETQIGNLLSGSDVGNRS